MMLPVTGCISPPAIIRNNSNHIRSLADITGHKITVNGFITNGWWGNTAGYKQHNSYAKLRAVEFRRSIARSANTGISGFIDQKGKELIQTEWWKQDVIRYTIHTNDYMTVYANWGDYLGRIGSFIAIAMLLSTIVKSKTTILKKPRKA